MRLGVLRIEHDLRTVLVIEDSAVDLALVAGSQLRLNGQWPDDYRTIHQHRPMLKELCDSLEAEIQEGRTPDGYLGSLQDFDLAHPVIRPGKILCVGLNYSDHVEEVGLPTPQRPHVFSKLRTALNGPTDSVEVPWDIAAEIDYEAELAMVVGATCKAVPEERALDYILGYCVANDVSARDWQFAADDQLTLGKGFDGFLPLGPYLVVDEVDDPADLVVRCWVDGELRQEASTADMVAKPAAIVSFLSSICTLEPGDIIATGTPAGVGWGRTPKALLGSGQRMVTQIVGIGSLDNQIE